MADSEDRRLDEILNKLPAAEARELVKSLVITTLRELDTDLIPETLHTVQETLGHTDAVMAAVEELRGNTGDTKEDVLLKALTLYEAALGANEKGQRLVVVGPDYRFIREIIGFDRSDRESVRSAVDASGAPYAHGKQVGVAGEPGRRGNIAG